MRMFAALFKNMVYSLFITAFLSLIGLSLFVGNFPPSVKQVKTVWAQYKSLLQWKEQFLAQNRDVSSEDLANMMQNEKRMKLKGLRASVGTESHETQNPMNAMSSYYESLEKLGDETQPLGSDSDDSEKSMKHRSRSVANTASYGEKRVTSLPELQEQVYQMRAEILRLNHRIVELERQKSEVSAPQSASSVNPRSR